MKSTYQISSLHLKSLDNAEFFQLMTETKEAIATFTKTNKQEAAYTPLAQLFKNYAGLSTQSYEKETEGINHLLNQLKEAHYQAALTRLHLSVHVETLKTAQKQFEKVYKERLAEQSSQTPSQIKEIRQQLQELHEFYVDFTAITAYAYPDRTAYASLRDQLNTIRDRYKKLQPTKKTNKTAAMSSENGTV